MSENKTPEDPQIIKRGLASDTFSTLSTTAGLATAIKVAWEAKKPKK